MPSPRLLLIAVIAQFVALLTPRAPACAAPREMGAFHARTFTNAVGPSLPYGLFVPSGLTPGRKLPLVLFLHGQNERGMDNRRQLPLIIPWTSQDVQARFPCFIAAPQCPYWKEVFQLYGHNRDRAITAYADYGGSAAGTWKHYRVSAGLLNPGRAKWLFFFNDDRGRDKQVESLYRNVRVYESGQPLRARTIDFRRAPLTDYAGGGRGNNPTVEDNGATLHLIGDTRKKIAFPCTVTRSTILEFDFKSGTEGEVQGIGFDDDDKLTEYQWVDADLGAATHTVGKEPAPPLKRVMELIPALEREYPAIDARRIYVVGFAMGGFAVWELLARRPDLFAAGVPISGGADLETASRVAGVPIWAFHGSQDGNVRPDRSRSMIAALWDIGAEPRYTEYIGLGYDAWDRALQEPGLLPWLFGNRRAVSPPAVPNGLKVVRITPSRVELAWNPTRDADSGIKEYSVLRDGGEVGITRDARFVDLEVGEQEVHSYRVVAVSDARLKSAPSAEVWARIPADTQPPLPTLAEAQGVSTRVEVHFDKPIDRRTAQDPANYALDNGVAVREAVLLPGERIVRLETGALTPRLQYHLTVRRVADRAAKPHVQGEPVTLAFLHDPCLAAHWRFDEGAGAFSADASGNGSGSSGNAVTFRSVEWVPGRWGKALGFDGVWDHYAWTRQSASLDLTDGLTISLWIKKAPGLHARQTLIAKSNYYDHRTQFMLELDASQRVHAVVGMFERGELSVTGTRIDARDWHHIAFSCAGGKLELYVDGRSQGMAEGGDKLMSVSEMITIGSGHQGRDPVRGALDEIRVYNRALSATEIAKLAAADDE